MFTHSQSRTFSWYFVSQNRLTNGVFTSDHIIVLDFLCTQAAISLENARLYNQVQQTLTELQQAQLQIVQTEKCRL